MSEFRNGPREIYGVEAVMNRVRVIQQFEEDRYSEVPKWGGMISAWSDNSPGAVLLYFDEGKRPTRENWFPLSQLRKTEDGKSIYASIWILDKKGF